MNLAVLYARQGKLAAAREVFLNVLSHAQELYDPELVCLLHHNIGSVNFDLQDFEPATMHAKQALSMAQHIGNRLHLARALRLLGDVGMAQGLAETGRRMWTQALQIFDELRDPRAEKLREELTASA